MGFGPICETQGGSGKSTSDFEEVSAVDREVYRALEILCQVEDNLRWVKKPWKSVGDYGGRGVKFKRSKSVVEVKLRVALELEA